MRGSIFEEVLEVEGDMAAMMVGNRIAVVGAGEPMVMIIIEIADRERGCAVVDLPEEIVSAKGEDNAMPVYGPSRPNASALVCKPAIREVNDNVLVDGGVIVVEFACVEMGMVSCGPGFK